MERLTARENGHVYAIGCPCCEVQKEVNEGMWGEG